MDYIERATRCLEHIPSTLRKDNLFLEETITQLSSTARLLISSDAPNKHSSIGDDLRRQLLNLSRITLTASLEYLASMLTFFHYMRGTPAENVSIQWNWEYLSVSILSAVLDFLEDRPNNKDREKIAFTLYPVICPNYFIQDPGEPISFQGDLLSTVYQTLTAIIVSHPTNGLKFCAEVDRKTLGITISETKDLLALESLLDLFGCLIPSAKAGRAKRTVFIKDVFDSAIFIHSGESIQTILEDISSPDWNVTSEKILKILASHDLSFPQPFEAYTLKINETCLALSAPLYVDAKQFVANIQKDGEIETCCVPYTTVLDISLVESLKRTSVHTSALLSKPPLLGNKPISMYQAKSILLSWSINESQFSRFSEALRARHIKRGHSVQDKLSKVKPIALDFFPTKKDPHDLTRERLHQLSQSWILNRTPKLDKDCTKEPGTSPLLPCIARSNDEPLKVDAKFDNEVSNNDSYLASSTASLAANVNTSSGIMSNENAGTESNNIHLGQGQTSYLYSQDQEAVSMKSEKELIREKSESPIVAVKAPFINAILPFDRRHLQRKTLPAPFSVIEDTELVKKRSIAHVDFDKLVVNQVYTPKRRRRESTSSSPVRVLKTVKYTTRKIILSPASAAPPTNDIDVISLLSPEDTAVIRVEKKNAGGQARHERLSTSRKKGVKGKKMVSAKEVDLSMKVKCHKTNPSSTDAPKTLRRSTRVAKLQSPTPIVRQSPKKVRKDPTVEAEIKQAHRFNDLELVQATSNEQSHLANTIVASPFNAIASPQLKLSLESQNKGSRSTHHIQLSNIVLDPVMIDLTASSPSPVPKTDIKMITKDIHSLPKPDEPTKVARINDVLLDDQSLSVFHVRNINTHSSPQKWQAMSRNETSYNAKLTFDRTVDILKVETAAHNELDASYQMTKTLADEKGDAPSTSLTFALHRSKNLRYNTNKIALAELPKKPILEVPDRIGARRALRPIHSNQVPLPERKDLPSKRIKHDPLQKIIAVVQQINKVVVQNIEHRFENVTENLNSGQRKMLEESATGLREIYHDSVQYFNDMVDLEENYTSQCSTFNTAIHDYIKSSEQVAQTFEDVTLEHGRRTLSKSFVPTLLSKTASVPKLS